MKTITVTELNRNPSAPLRDVQEGQTVIVTSHGKPVARITPITDNEWEQTIKMLSVSPAQMTPKSHFVVPPFLDVKSRPRYKKEKIKLPIHINWSHRDLIFDMSKSDTRARLYEKVLREGDIVDIQKYIVFSDLKKLWSSLYLPTDLRKAWEVMYPSLKE